MFSLAYFLMAGDAANLPTPSPIGYSGPTSISDEVAEDNSVASVFIRFLPNGTTWARSGIYIPPTTNPLAEDHYANWYFPAEGEAYNPTIGSQYEIKFTDLGGTGTLLMIPTASYTNATVLNTWQPIHFTTTNPQGPMRGVRLDAYEVSGPQNLFKNVQVEIRKISDPAEYVTFNIYLSSTVLDI